MTEATPRRRRARKSDGKFKADDPNTVTNEAWEAVPVEDSLSGKDVKYNVKQKVSGTSGASAGKYGKKDKVRPTFGKVYSTYN